MEEHLIVDGYNMIGAWPRLSELKALSLPTAREQLIATLSEYAVFTGKRVILVFDAYQVKGGQTVETYPNCTVVFTQAGETADQYIEKLVGQLKASGVERLFVATSDDVEQRIAFGRGALRLSARELLDSVRRARAQVSTDVRNRRSGRLAMRHRLTRDIRQQLEAWRRQS